MIAKNVFLILLVFYLNNLFGAQEDFTSATLVSSPMNTAHPFYDLLLKKGPKYVEWLYFHCKGLADKNTLTTPMNTPLVFSITQNGAVLKDTIPNCVHPKLYENERELEWQSEIPLYGSFPDYINFHLTNDPKKGATIVLNSTRVGTTIKIYVLTVEGDMVSSISSKRLTKGIHKFHWLTKDIKAGNYLLFSEIDDYLTIHTLRVEKNWFTNIFSRDSEVSHKKKVIRFSFEEGDIPTTKGEFQYIRKNRFGTNLGLNLLEAAMVKIKLLGINGDYIATIHHKKLNAGESEFLLDKYIEKTGWYLIQLTIDGKRMHLKTKIKK
ncbi:hypothetical protein N9954_03465 [Maribacter sp.]|nr:hypothetical protein [Maribacter sp.]